MFPDTFSSFREAAEIMYEVAKEKELPLRPIEVIERDLTWMCKEEGIQWLGDEDCKVIPRYLKSLRDPEFYHFLLQFYGVPINSRD